MDRALIDQPSSYSLSANGGAPVVTAVYRKSSPSQLALIAQPMWETAMRHTISLQLSEPLVEGRAYTLDFADPRVASTTLVMNSDELRSDAIHVNQVGFRPVDPKFAYLSWWLGNSTDDGGGVSYPNDLTYEIIRTSDGSVVHSGNVQFRRGKTDKDDAAYTKGAPNFPYADGRYNYSKVDVFEMDFSDFNLTGTFRIVVPGIGCSYDFEVRDDIWEVPFKLSMRGFFHQRSGMEFTVNEGIPGQQWTRPLNFHPDNGDEIWLSTFQYFGSDGGFDDLIAGKTSTPVTVWGGYHDAGDWDRRIDHLYATYNKLDLAELFPGYFNALSLGVPASGSVLPDSVYANLDLPDIIDEALWNLDFYRRLQLPSGGVPGGIESAAHPRWGEPSWLESLEIYQYSADAYSSYYYSVAAAKAGIVLRPYSTELANLYRDTAIAAFSWAETQTIRPDAVEKTRRIREWAASEMYRLTGDNSYQAVYLDVSGLDDLSTSRQIKDVEQMAAAYTYAITNHPNINQTVKDYARDQMASTVENQFIERSHDRSAFRTLKYGWTPVGWGNGTQIAMRVENVLRAYMLTGNPLFLEAVINGTGFGLGANPKNLVYTTGLGDNPVTSILHNDSHYAGQPVPVGLSVYGPYLSYSYSDNSNNWPSRSTVLGGDQALVPAIEYWPIYENYHEFWKWPAMVEYTVHQNFAPSAYVWGFLAAMDGLNPPSVPDGSGSGGSGGGDLSELTVVSSTSTDAGSNPDKAHDGDLGYTWITSTLGAELVLDLGAEYNVGAVDIINNERTDGREYVAEIWVSTSENSGYQKVWEGQTQTGSPHVANMVSFSPQNARYVKLVARGWVNGSSSGPWYHLAELIIYSSNCMLLRFPQAFETMVGLTRMLNQCVWKIISAVIPQDVVERLGQARIKKGGRCRIPAKESE